MAKVQLTAKQLEKLVTMIENEIESTPGMPDPERAKLETLKKKLVA